MTTIALSEEQRSDLREFLRRHPRTDLVGAYLHYVENKFQLKPVAFPKGRIIFQSIEAAIKYLGEKGELWRETEIKIGYNPSAVNEETEKLYICPFSGKVFGDNTHPNPQDAIYDWVSKCPENTERKDGLRVKRFHVSEDKEVIKEYIPKRTKTVTKVVFSSAINGKLYHSKDTVIEDFKENYVKPLTVHEVQNQDRFEIEDSFMNFLQEQLQEEKIGSFVDVVAEDEKLIRYVEKWLAAAEAAEVAEQEAAEAAEAEEAEEEYVEDLGEDYEEEASEAEDYEGEEEEVEEEV